MSKRLEENDIIDSTTNNIVNNYGTINGNVIAAQYSMIKYAQILKTVSEHHTNYCAWHMTHNLRVVSTGLYNWFERR